MAFPVFLMMQRMTSPRQHKEKIGRRIAVSVWARVMLASVTTGLGMMSAGEGVVLVEVVTVGR